MLTYQTSISKKSKWVNMHIKHNVIELDEDSKSDSPDTSEELEAMQSEIQEKLEKHIGQRRMTAEPRKLLRHQLSIQSERVHTGVNQLDLSKQQ